MPKDNELISGFFTYMGNKHDLAKWIIPYFPKHKVYAEIFGGTGAILLNKPKSQVEIYNDFNSNLSNLFHVVRTRYDEFVEQINKLVISEDWHKMFYKNHSGDNELENAIRYYYVMVFTFRGKYDGGFSYTSEPSFCNTLQRKLPELKDIHERIKNVIILNKTCFDVVKQNNDKDTLLYLDPPYVSTEMYYETLAGSFTETDHIKLRDLLEKHTGYFFLSYEDDELVSDLYGKFHIHRKELLRASSKSTKYEVLITNYKPQNTLFSIQ